MREVKVAFSPRGEALRLILRELKSARDSVDVAMFYFSHKDLIDALCFLSHQRGVEIRVLTGAQMDQPAYRPIRERLMQHGVSIHILPLPREGRMHLKCAVIDGQTVIAGTANWSPTAFDQNFEDTLIIRSEALSRRYREQMEALLAKAEPIRSHSYDDKPPGRITFPEIGDYEVLKQTDRLQAPRARVVRAVRHAEVYFQPGREGIRQLLSQARAERGVYVYLLLHMPTSVQDRLHQSHSNWAEKLRAKGIDVQLNMPHIHLHAKMVVVDLAKVLIGSHNWSEGALSGQGVYESSALLVLPEQDIRFADYILSRQTVSDMRSKDLWEQEIALLRHVAVMSSSERAAFLRDREAQAVP